MDMLRCTNGWIRLLSIMRMTRLDRKPLGPAVPRQEHSPAAFMINSGSANTMVVRKILEQSRLIFDEHKIYDSKNLGQESYCNQPAEWVYTDRTAGGDRHHRHFG